MGAVGYIKGIIMSIKRYKSIVSEYRLVKRFKAILGDYDVSEYILSSVDIKAVNEAIWTL